ncbi:hypothetical protein TYRP_017133 [Tyrophagus putrescentiae]|nr:hypothetical protein TYRP_017133 [Tyrophagus putrescentiae]
MVGVPLPLWAEGIESRESAEWKEEGEVGTEPGAVTGRLCGQPGKGAYRQLFWSLFAAVRGNGDLLVGALSGAHFEGLATMAVCAAVAAVHQTVHVKVLGAFNLQKSGSFDNLVQLHTL